MLLLQLQRMRPRLGLDFFTDTSIPWPWYVARTAAARQATGFILWVLAYLLVYRSQPIDTYRLYAGKVWLLTLFTSPVIETLEMAGAIALCQRLRIPPMWTAALSGALIGSQHFGYNVAVGAMWTWGFFVYALCFLAWEKKSWLSAVLVTAAVHSFDNLLWILRNLIGVALYGPDWNVYPLKCMVYLFCLPFNLWGMR